MRNVEKRIDDLHEYIVHAKKIRPEQQPKPEFNP